MTVTPSRALAAAIEPFAAQVYFAPECHRSYAELGFGPSLGKTGEVALPDGPAYLCSRGALLGQVPGEVVAATFAVFNPAIVVPAVAYGWTLTDAKTIGAARSDGAVRQLRRILGDRPDGIGHAVKLLRRATERLSVAGKPLFAGALAQGLSGDPLHDAWRLADQLREYRGDVHIGAWVSAGFDAVEIVLVTELYRGFALRTQTRYRAWADYDLEAGEQRLTARGLIRDGALTDAGWAAREAVEVVTDEGCAPIVAALGDDLAVLVELIDGWSKRVRAAGGYPAAGPEDLTTPAVR